MTSRTWLAPALWSLALAALFLQFIVYLAHAAAILPYPFDIDQGEGYDVNAGWLLSQGRPIYTSNESYPYFSSNYPPLYSLAVASAIGIWGPTLLAGRAVSLASTLSLGVLVYLAGRGRVGALGGLVAAGVFWMSSYVYHVTPLARVNALAALLAFAGLLCVARRGRGWVILGAGLLLAALYTKPTAIDAAIAGLLYLWLQSRRLAIVVGTGLAGVGLGLLILLELASDRNFLLNVFAGNVNPFLPAQLRDYLVNFGLLHAVPLGLALFSTAQSLRDGRPGPVHLFFLTGLLLALGVGKSGAGESYFLSAIVASSVLAGQVAGRLVQRGGVLANAVPLLLIVQTLVSAHGAVSTLVPALPDRGLQAAALAPEPVYADLERGHGIVTRLRSLDGPALVEDPGFELAAGREIVGNATHLRNLHQSGLWRPDNLVADVIARRYHTVVLDAELYPEPVLMAIGRSYFLYDSVDVHRATQKVFFAGAT